MSGFVVAAREVREKSLLLLIAVAFAPLPFIAAAFPARHGDRLATIAVVGGFVAVFLSWGSAVLLGATTVGKEMSENRLSFFFTKPVSASAIWFGKAGASLALSLAAFGIAAGPALIVGRRELDHVWLGTQVILTIAVVGTVVLFFLAHALSTMTRSRSALLGLDFVGAIIAVAATALIVRPILFAGGFRLAAILLGAILLGFLLIVALAPIRQLSIGRTDALRSHRALSATIWISAAVVLVVAAGYSTWATSASPADLAAVAQVQQSPRGDTFLISGRSPARGDYPAEFLVDTATGTHRRIAWRMARYSGDGRVVAWFQLEGFVNPQLQLYVARGSEVRATDIRFGSLPYFSLSSDGRRVAIARYGAIEVHDLDSGRLVAAAEGLDRRSRLLMSFADTDVLRIYEQPTAAGAKEVPLQIYEFNTAARKLRKTGERLMPPIWPPIQLSADGRTMLVDDGVIADARTGATLETLPRRGKRWLTAMLHDGGVVTIATEGRLNTLLLYGPDAQLRRETPLGSASGWRVVGETTNGKLLLDRIERSRSRGSSLVIVDLRRGAIERTVSGFFAPFDTSESQVALHDERLPVAGMDDQGKLALVDVRTGVKRPLKD